jgi:hypothetical protein
MPDRLTDADIKRGLELAQAAKKNWPSCWEPYQAHACEHYPAALQELIALRAEAKLTPAELRALRTEFG